MKKVSKILYQSIFLNTLLVLFKITTGILGRSSSIIADGIHSLSDLTTDIIAIIGNKLASKPADEKHPYGYGQVEYLTSIIVGVAIFLVGLFLCLKSFTINNSNTSILVLYISVIAFIVKLSFSKYLLKKGKEYKSSILVASGIESRADALTTLFVVISFIISKFNSYADNICTLVIGIYIIYISINIIKENVINVIGCIEDDETYIEKIRKLIRKNPEVLEINELELLRYGSYYSANICISLNRNLKLKDIDTIINKIKRQLCNKRTRISYIKVRVKPFE
jgi:cation diffusion facilitator family transporter